MSRVVRRCGVFRSPEKGISGWFFRPLGPVHSPICMPTKAEGRKKNTGREKGSAIPNHARNLTFRSCNLSLRTHPIGYLNLRCSRSPFLHLCLQCFKFSRLSSFETFFNFIGVCVQLSKGNFALTAHDRVFTTCQGVSKAPIAFQELPPSHECKTTPPPPSPNSL